MIEIHNCIHYTLLLFFQAKYIFCFGYFVLYFQLKIDFSTLEIKCYFKFLKAFKVSKIQKHVELILEFGYFQIN